MNYIFVYLRFCAPLRTNYAAGYAQQEQLFPDILRYFLPIRKQLNKTQ